MNIENPNLLLLESVAHSLGSLCDRFVFVGGCATGLLITDAAAAPVRVTQDVDVIVEVTSFVSYHALELQLEEAGFEHDTRPEAPLCRWLVNGRMLDVVPADGSVLGFNNRWYAEAIRTSQTIRLPRGMQIRLIAPPVFIATKLEAFRDRGAGDFSASHDLEDIIIVIDGRPGLVAEAADSSIELQNYLADEIGSLVRNPAFLRALPGHLLGDSASQARLPELVRRFQAIASLKESSHLDDGLAALGT